jgi:hypothetical protein
MICAKCSRDQAAGEYSFWSYKKDEMPADDGVVPIHRFSAVICDRCNFKRRFLVISLISFLLPALAFGIMLSVGHGSVKWALLASGLTFVFSLVVSILQTKKELFGSSLAAGSQKKRLSAEGYEGFFPSKPKEIVRYRS